MLLDFLAANGVEIWNNARLQAYLTNVGSPFDTGPSICGCDTLTAEVLGMPTPYNTPATDPAPWYDTGTPASGQFLGFMPLTIDGIDDNPRARSVTNAVGGGGIFGPQRVQPRTITVTGVLIGATCCGADYGLNYLSQVLSACDGNSCDGDCLRMYDCCPDPGLTAVQFNAQHRRTFRRTALVSGPTVTGRRGSGSCASSNCAAGAELIEVEFILVAATPWAYTEPTPVLDVTWPVGGTGDCIDWCVSNSTSATCGGEPCLFYDCGLSTDCAQDPLITVVAPPTPTLPTTSFCVPLVPERACYELDLSNRPRWSDDVPIIEVSSGATAMRNTRIVFYPKTDAAMTCDQIADSGACSPANEFIITYLPANSTLTIDGQTGQSFIDCGDGCQPAPYVYGDQDGGPVAVYDMNCDKYCVCLEVDNSNPVAADARVSIELSGKGL